MVPAFCYQPRNSQKAEYMKTIFRCLLPAYYGSGGHGKLITLTKIIASPMVNRGAGQSYADNLGGDFLKSFSLLYEAVGTDLYDQQEESLQAHPTATRYVKADNRIKIIKNWRDYWHYCRWRTGLNRHHWHWSRCVSVASPFHAIIAAGLACWVRSLPSPCYQTASSGAISFPPDCRSGRRLWPALLIRKYWETHQRIAIEGIMSALHPVGKCACYRQPP